MNIGSKLIKAIRDKGNSIEGEMSFFEHLEALRWHFLRSAFAVLVFAIVTFIYYDDIFKNIIMAPTHTDFWTYRMMCNAGAALQNFNSYFKAKSFCVEKINVKLINTELAGQFNLQLNSSIMIGLTLGIPYLLFEIWRFIRPALHEKERKAASGFVFYSSFLFFLGVLFGYYVVTPLSIRFLASYTVSDTIENLFSIDSYISSVTMLTLLAGIVFQLPIVVYILSSLGILTPKFMREKRRYATVIILVIAAIITPSPDALTMLVVAMPLFILYELSIIVSAVVQRRRKREELNAE
ncbi:sec-independent protein translocase protein TatC [Mucilaginibacter frigoritolerans]|uniref:Sec-independent protein translocase protein TatC n=1 Tax=Mucilaginibacter frigoritolerans TaxID=652788 RepID=A0A562TYU5_9SPHI|nr:twin-arginine translocase subunit TatC [Mucilaginibacter frigoritolerans]TWI98791.1 sec-independent protein translocase protein TatC [Mucilaginibacter frigoritolerans]